MLGQQNLVQEESERELRLQIRLFELDSYFL